MVAFKSLFDINDPYPKLRQVLLSRIQRHAWYLTEQLVMLGLADDDVDMEAMKNKLEKLVECNVPEFHMEKPKLPVISRSTKLTDLIGSQSLKGIFWGTHYMVQHVGM